MANKSPRYHSEHLLEAQVVSHQLFSSTAFGRLPPEVRHTIYTFVEALDSPFANRSPCWLKGQNKSGSLRATLPLAAGSRHRSSKTLLSLMFVCRQIYEEVQPLYYNSEYFCFTKAESMRGLLFETGWATRSDMQVIWICLGGDECAMFQEYEEAKALWEELSCLIHCKYLRRLNIFIEDEWHQGSNLCPNFVHPFTELKNIEIIVSCYKARMWSISRQDWQVEAHQWRLIRDDAEAHFEIWDGEAEKGIGGLYSQWVGRIVPQRYTRWWGRDTLCGYYGYFRGNY